MKTINLLYEIGDSVWGIKNNEVKLFVIDRITIIESGIGYQAQPVEKPEYVTSEFHGVTFNKDNMKEYE